MTRAYLVFIEAKNIDTFVLESYLRAERWIIILGGNDILHRGDAIIHCYGTLGGGMSTKEYHDELEKKVKSWNSNAKLLTSWRYVEEIEPERYGGDEY